MSRPADHAPDQGHVVQFYDAAADVGAAAGAFLAAGLAAGEAAVIVARPEVASLLEGALRGAGIDVDGCRRSGELVWLDAAAALAEITAGGAVDADRVLGELGRLVDGASLSGLRPVRVFGEMVALLWEAGDVAGAITLERAWNRLAEDQEFALYCAYPSADFDGDDVDAFHRVCGAHSQVVAPAPSTVDDLVPAAASRTLPRGELSPRAARRFVTANLVRWGSGELVDAAALVVSELATNAVLHARSPFTVSVAVVDRAVRVEVRDRDPRRPRPTHHSLESATGRGLHLIDALCSSWGADTVTGGKVVWVELARG